MLRLLLGYFFRDPYSKTCLLILRLLLGYFSKVLLYEFCLRIPLTSTNILFIIRMCKYSFI